MTTKTLWNLYKLSHLHRLKPYYLVNKCSVAYNLEIYKYPYRQNPRLSQGPNLPTKTKTTLLELIIREIRLTG